MTDVLADIVRHKRAEIADLDPPTRAGAAVRDFAAALRGRSRAIIAEIKRRSPGEGAINEGCDIAVRAQQYAAGGAAALSVLTDGTYFGGHIDDLTAVRELTALPVVRKDFIIDARQVIEARAHGADACLLIVGAIPDDALASLKAAIEACAMTAIIEVNDADQLRRACALDPQAILINQRNLRDLSVARDTVDRLYRSCPDDVALIAASGMRDADDVARLPERVNGVLIGTTLMRSTDPTELLLDMNAACGSAGVR